MPDPRANCDSSLRRFQVKRMLLHFGDCVCLCEVSSTHSASTRGNSRFSLSRETKPARGELRMPGLVADLAFPEAIGELGP